MGVLERLTSRVATEAVAPDAAPVVRLSSVPSRKGFEYGIPLGGSTEQNAGLHGTSAYDRQTFLGQLYDTFLACPWASACAEVIARTTTAGGLQIVADNQPDLDSKAAAKPAPGSPDPGNFVQNEAEPDDVRQLRTLLDFVNPRDDIRQLLRSLIIDLLVFGDAYLEVVWWGGRPVALYNLDPPSMIPIADEHGDIDYYVQVLDPSRKAYFSSDEVIHISLDAPRGGLFGVGPTQRCLQSIVRWLFTAAVLKETMRKGNPPNLRLDFEKGTTDAEIKRWRQQYLVQNLGPRNIGVPITTKGVTATGELAMAKINEYLETLDRARDEIIAGFGVPKRKLSIAEPGQLGGSGVEEGQDKTFRVNTCAPLGNIVIEKLNFHLVFLGFGIRDWHLRFAEFDWRDSKIVEDIRDQRIRNGTWTLNRARDDVGEPPVEGGELPVIVERTNMVLWEDLPEYSKATVAAVQLKGADQSAMAEPMAHGVESVEDEPPPRGTPDADVRALGESWQHRYRARRKRALKELERT